MADPEREARAGVVLWTERLLLRPWRVADAAVQREWWTERDARVPPHRRIDADGHPTLEELRERIRTRPPGRLLAAERRDTGEVPSTAAAWSPPGRSEPVPSYPPGTVRPMSCRITELVVDCQDPERLAAFWCEVLGFVVLGRETPTSVEIGPAGAGFGGPQPTIVFDTTDGPKKDKLRLHFDVNPTDTDQAAELERLLALGATRADIGQRGDEPWHVLADPEGNEFCLLRRRVPVL